MTRRVMRVTSMVRRLPMLLLAIAAACSGTTEPRSLGKLNTAAALADYSAMDGVLQSTGWKHFQMTASGMTAMGSTSTTTSIAAGALANLAPGGNSRAAATAMASIVASGTAGIQLISTANLGKTFIYDGQGHRWVVDPTRTGAPSNGVRFITYEPKGIEPDPTKPTGYADLIDQGSTSAGIALRLVVLEGNFTVLDYRTTVDGSNGVGHVTVNGFVQNRNDKLEFDIDVHGGNANGVDRGDISFDLAIASRGFHVEGDVHSEKSNGAEHSTVDLSVRHSEASFRVDVANDVGALSGVVNLNDAPFATVSGRDGAPVFKTPAGGDLNPAQGLVLLKIFDVTEDVFDLFEDLIDPIDDLVILAFIL
jgi:hypothetical protein